MHFAAFVKVDESVKKPKKYFNNNYNKTKSFLNYCFEQGLNKIIFSSTASVYGNRKKKVKEKNKLLPDNPYALSKMKCEEFILDADQNKKCKFVILRYFNVAGSPKNLKTGLITNEATHLIKKLCEFIIRKKWTFNIYGKKLSDKRWYSYKRFYTRK